jgi:hypothetical protein
MPRDTPADGPDTVPDRPRPLREEDLHLFNEGTHLRLWERLGSHPATGRRGGRALRGLGAERRATSP